MHRLGASRAFWSGPSDSRSLLSLCYRALVREGCSNFRRLPSTISIMEVAIRALWTQERSCRRQIVQNKPGSTIREGRPPRAPYSRLQSPHQHLPKNALQPVLRDKPIMSPNSVSDGERTPSRDLEIKKFPRRKSVFRETFC